MSNLILPSRRDFLKTSAGAVSTAALAGSLGSAAFAQEGAKPIRIVLVGCGGRGTGAIHNLFNASNIHKVPVKLVAVCDAFIETAQSKAQGFVNFIEQKKNEFPYVSVDLPAERQFGDLDSYKKAIDVDCDLVVIATPPGFKPQQFEYAVAKGRHIFMEKPVAVDAPGIRRCMVANDAAKAKNLLVAIGLQRRHQDNYIQGIKALQDGVIGDINLLRVYWNNPGIWYRNKYKDVNSMRHQVDNWYHFVWTCGDQIAEQHIHNLDVGCWIKDDYPVECNGMGGSEMRMGGDGTKSQIFDHTFCEYVFKDGTRMYSQGRHVAGAWSPVAEFAHGSKGWGCPQRGFYEADGVKNKLAYDKKLCAGHQQEQTDLLEKLSKGEIYNEGDFGIKSTFTAILGREACYSAKVLKWDELLANGKDYCPGIDSITLDSAPLVTQDENGKFPVARPGIYNPFAE